MSDDVTVAAPSPAGPYENVPPAHRKERWGVVAIVVVIGLVLVVASALYSRQQHNDRADAQRDRVKAAALVHEEQRKLDVATDHYNTVKENYDAAVRGARRLALRGSELADKATIATQALASYSEFVRSLTQAWLNNNVDEFNRVIAQANAYVPQLNAATGALIDAVNGIILDDSSSA